MTSIVFKLIWIMQPPPTVHHFRLSLIVFDSTVAIISQSFVIDDNSTHAPLSSVSYQEAKRFFLRLLVLAAQFVTSSTYSMDAGQTPVTDQRAFQERIPFFVVTTKSWLNTVTQNLLLRNQRCSVSQKHRWVYQAGSRPHRSRKQPKYCLRPPSRVRQMI